MRYKLTVKEELARETLKEFEKINKKAFDWLLNGEPKYSEEFIPEIAGYKILPPVGNEFDVDGIYLNATLVVAEAFEEPTPKKKRGHVIEEMWAFCTVDPNDGCEGVIGGVINGVSMPLVGSDRARFLSLIPVAKEVAKASGLKVTIKHFTLCHAHSLEQDSGHTHDKT
ncbi:MAG: hypothetical protein MUP21_13535 [Dehalococcoidia bacterium]|nr:hypothetical protein [Dehalococcoidia bacterium]